MNPKRILRNCLAATAILMAPLCSQAAPANDMFANRTLLTGSSIDFVGNTYLGTFEPHDPTEALGIHGWDPTPEHPEGKWIYHPEYSASVWWSWTPSITGYALLSFPTIPPHILHNDPVPRFPQFSIFEGMSSKILARLPNRLADVRRRQSMPFRIIAGQTYTFVLLSASNGDTNLLFHLQASATPNILEHPQSQTISVGDSACFTVLAPIYGTNGNVQWQRNGVNIPGATGPTFQIDNATTADAGEYRALVNTLDSSAITVSQPAALIVQGVDVEPEVQLHYVEGSQSDFAIRVLGQPNHHYTIQYSANFTFDLELLVPGISSHLPLQPYLAHGVDALFDPGSTNIVFFRAIRAGDLRKICSANLRRIEFGKIAWQHYFQRLEGAALNEPEIDRMFLDSERIRCPLGGNITYYVLGSGAYRDVAGHAQ